VSAARKQAASKGGCSQDWPPYKNGGAAQFAIERIDLLGIF
jgi:hypothetical protein